MKKEQYETINAWFEQKPRRLHLLKSADVFCVGCAVAAVLEQLFQFQRENPAPTIRFALTCGVPLVLLSAARKFINAPRPYEVYGLQPLMPRESSGKSFPSRHVFSIFVIAGCYLHLLPGEGAVLLLLGVILAAIRVLAGLHFEKDVIAGAVIGLLSAFVGYDLIP